jgi:hypothetical protein
MITYYSDLKDINSIHNPLMDNSTEMRHSGFFDVAQNDSTPYFGTSLKKTLHNKGSIFCDDSSKLFSITTGYVNLLISFPHNIIKGVYSKTRDSDHRYLIWGVNVGQLGIGNPGLGAYLSKDGIEFAVHTSSGLYTIVDQETTVMRDMTFELEFLWDSTGITGLDDGVTTLIRSNGQDIVGGSAPIIDDLDVNTDFYTDIGQSAPTGTSVLEDVSFYLLENSYNLNNLQCSISRLMIEDGIPQSFLLEH